MKIFFENYDLFMQMFTPLIGKELEMIISGRREKAHILGFENGNGTYGFELLINEEVRIVYSYSVWEILVP
jgi:hypothetical protein